MSLCICVATWSAMLSDFKTLAASPGIDELQLMSTYANPSGSMDLVKSYFADVKSGSGGLDKAGVTLSLSSTTEEMDTTRTVSETTARNFIKTWL